MFSLKIRGEMRCLVTQNGSGAVVPANMEMERHIYSGMQQGLTGHRQKPGIDKSS